MIKKIIIRGAHILWTAFFFYKQCMDPALKPFFKKFEGVVGFFGGSPIVDKPLPEE